MRTWARFITLSLPKFYIQRKMKTKQTLSIIILVLIFIVLTIIIIGIKNKSIENKLFQELPQKPRDFLIFKRAVEKGEIIDLCKLEEKYYKNPEFYITWEQGKQIFYDNHDYSRWGVHGYGAYPGDLGMVVTDLKKGEEIEFCTLLKTSYGIETYQGVKLLVPESEYFDIEISPQEYENYSNHFLLEPTFPIFKKGWVKKVKIKLIAKQDIPSDTYYFGFNLGTPDGRFSDDRVWELLMSDTNEDFEYVKSCMKELSNKKENTKTNNKCENFMLQRQKKYIQGGMWGIGRDMIGITLIVE